MNHFITRLLLLGLFPCFSFAQNPPHRFKVGEKIPDLVLADAFGDSIKTSQLKGKKILLTFNRYVSCPLCNFRTHQLLEHYDTLKENGLVIISVYESGKETLTEYTTKEEVPFHMIPDPQLLLYKKFKVQKSWWKTFKGLFNHYRAKHATGEKLFKSNYKRDGHLNRIGADFLIDENGIIRSAYYGKFVGDHLPVEEIMKWVLSK
ncbi:MAG: peroxiredoxin family protein [Bacteroidia bacterium]